MAGCPPPGRLFPTGRLPPPGWLAGQEEPLPASTAPHSSLLIPDTRSSLWLGHASHPPASPKKAFPHPPQAVERIPSDPQPLHPRFLTYHRLHGLFTCLFTLSSSVKHKLPKGLFCLGH